MRALAITPDNLENQRQAVKEERRQSVDNQAYGQTSEKLEELIYDNFAYHHPVVGSMADLDAASLDDVRQFFQTYYAPNNAVVALVGDLTAKETLAKARKYFGAIPRQEPPKPADLSEPAKDGERRATIADPLARAVRIDIAYRIPPSDQADARALGIAAAILGGGGGGRGSGGGANSSRLYRKLVDEKEVASQVVCATDQRAGPGIFRIAATLRPGRTPQEAEGLIAEEIARLHAEPVGERELQRVRASLRRSAESRVTALSRAQALADAAAVYDDPNRVNTGIDAQLAVTPAAR